MNGFSAIHKFYGFSCDPPRCNAAVLTCTTGRFDQDSTRSSANEFAGFIHLDQAVYFVLGASSYCIQSAHH